jgi:hypothetical protein
MKKFTVLFHDHDREHTFFVRVIRDDPATAVFSALLRMAAGVNPIAVIPGWPQPESPSRWRGCPTTILEP